MKPASMTKVSIVGIKEDLEPVIERLHSLQVLDIETYDGELETGESLEEAENVSELLVDLRSLLSKLPDSDKDGSGRSISRIQEEIHGLNRKVKEKEEEMASLESSISELKEKKGYFEKLSGLGMDHSGLEETETLDLLVGSFDQEKLRKQMPDERYEVFSGEKASAVFFQKGEKRRKAAEMSADEKLGLVETEFEGKPEEIAGRIESELESLRVERESLEEDLQEIADKWRSDLEEAESFLTEKVEKAEAPLEFGTTENTFVAEGWIPSERYEDVEEELADVTDGKVHIERKEGDNPPVKHDNVGPVKSFESLTDLMSVPRYSELDPSFIIFLTFPLFFGFMIGDAGYGLSSLLVFYAGYRYFPEASDIFRSLMYASVATVFFGLIYGDAFGYLIFGHHSELAKVTGIHLFEQIPILFHRSAHWGQVFQLSALIGVLHINAGYLLGLYNEYVNHGAKEAFLEKGSWLVLEFGVLVMYFAGATAGAPVVLIAVIMLYIGEGIAGVIEIPSLLSNVLSYLRLFGVSVAAFSLAKVVNSFASPLFATGGLLGLAGGVLMLMLGHSFNTFIKIMEGFLQGIRLHYVEMFSKFYEGGGRKYSPFGADA